MAEKKTAKVQTNTPAKKTMTKKARQTTKTKGGKPQKRLNRRTALITGASAGIGLDYATLLAEQGFDLVITARRKDRLQSLADRLETSYGVNIHIFPEDLSDPRAPKRLVEKITKEGLSIDFLVNNAGYTVPGNFDMAKWQSHADMLQTMLTAPTELCHLIGIGMAERGYGRIINMASVAGLLPGSPGGTLYGPVKSYLVKFSQALSAEYHDRGIHVQALCPGFVLSEFHDIAGNREQMNRLPKFMWLTGPDVCRKSYESVMENKGPIIVNGLFYKILATIVKILPSNLSTKLLSLHNRNATPLSRDIRDTASQSASQSAETRQ